MTPTTDAETTEELESRRAEIEEEIEELDGRRAEIADELEAAKASIREARSAHREGEASAEELSEAQGRVEALEGSFEELEEKIAERRIDLRAVRRELRDRGEIEELAELVREAEELWEEWDERRKKLAAMIEGISGQLVDRETRLAEIAERIRGEENLGRRLRDAGIDVDLSVLGGWKEPDLNLVKHWRRPGAARGVNPGVGGRPPERADLGAAEEIVEEALRLERESRE